MGSEMCIRDSSCIGVGDPAQCEAILDQQIYDTVSHKKTSTEGDKQVVHLSNQGLHVYAGFDKVIVLTKAHRLTNIDNPTTAEEHAFNARVEKFVSVLRRLRDLAWTCEDYYWLCKRKRSQLSYEERAAFTDAPVLMDFRRKTDDNPEENCDFFNRERLRAMAHREKKPVVRITAQHTGISEEEGLQISDECFNGHPPHLELSEGAPVILLHN